MFFTKYTEWLWSVRPGRGARTWDTGNNDPAPPLRRRDQATMGTLTWGIPLRMTLTVATGRRLFHRNGAATDSHSIRVSEGSS